MKREQKERKMVQNLPDDMITQVLSRLPAKSLYRFRSVSHSLLALISPNFIRANHNRERLFILFPKHYCVLDCYEATSSDPADDSADSVDSADDLADPADSSDSADSFDSADPADVACMVAVEYPFEPSYYTRVVTSCDSWLLLSLCYYLGFEYFLLNPFTREYKRFSISQDPVHFRDKFGICYDRSDGDYKVIQLKKKQDSALFYSVFSFKTNSWEWNGSSPASSYDIRSHGISGNGAVHFVCCYGSTDRNRRIALLSLDLKDKFKEVPEPRVKLFCNKYLWFGSLRGNLCAYGYISNKFMVYEMIRHGRNESWTRVCSIRTGVEKTISKPLGITKEGDVILRSSEETLLLYRKEEKTLETLLTFKKERMLQIASSADSLISFN